MIGNIFVFECVRGLKLFNGLTDLFQIYSIITFFI